MNSFYAGRGRSPTSSSRRSCSGWTNKVTQYPYNPDKAKCCSRSAGLHVAGSGRVLVSDRRVAAVHAGPEAELPGVRREPREVGLQGDGEERAVAARLRRCVNEGTAGDLNLIGWTGDFGDPDNFLGTFFQTHERAVRLPQRRDLQHRSTKAEAETNVKKRDRAVQAGEHHDHEYLPGVPYVHTQPGTRRSRRQSSARRRARSERPVRARLHRAARNGAELTAGGRRQMLRFIVRRLLLLVPILLGRLAPHLLLDPGAAGQPGRVAPR